jgi:hypothetical protein
MARQVKMVKLDHKALLVHKVREVTEDYRAYKVLLERKAHKANLVPKVPRESLDQKATKEKRALMAF